MIFNVDYDNVISREYVSDVSEFKNTAIVAGQGEGADRKIILVGNENTGINRYEMFVDARDIEDESALPDRGKNKLADYTCSDTYSSEVDSAEYQTKWNLGDVVVTIDHEYGVNMNERIVEVTEPLMRMVIRSPQPSEPPRKPFWRRLRRLHLPVVRLP